MNRKRGIGFADCLLAVTFAMVGGFGTVNATKHAHRFYYGYRERLIARQLIKQAQLRPLDQLDAMDHEYYDRYGAPVPSDGVYALEISHDKADSARVHHGTLTYRDLNGAMQSLKFERTTWVNHE